MQINAGTCGWRSFGMTHLVPRRLFYPQRGVRLAQRGRRPRRLHIHIEVLRRTDHFLRNSYGLLPIFEVERSTAMNETLKTLAAIAVVGSILVSCWMIIIAPNLGLDVVLPTAALSFSAPGARS